MAVRKKHEGDGAIANMKKIHYDASNFSGLLLSACGGSTDQLV